MRLAYDTDDGAGSRARFGLIVLHVDETIESEFRRLMNLDGVALYCTRIESGTKVTPETLRAMTERIPAAARLLPPCTTLDVIGYACTSAAAVIGSDRIQHAIRQARVAGHPGTFADTVITDPLVAVRSACRALGIRRLAFVSPYIASVSVTMRDLLEADGLTVSAFGSFEQADEHVVARIAPASIHQAILRVARSATCDGVFVSCTNARTLDIIESAESELGLPVISSNQALAWHMLRAAGLPDRRPAMGRLCAL